MSDVTEPVENVDPDTWPWEAPEQPPAIESWRGDVTANVPFSVFPILPLAFREGGDIRIDKDDFGTCFFIAGEVFLTAWHVVEAAAQAGDALHVGMMRPGVAEAGPVLSWERVAQVHRIVDTPTGRVVDIAMGLVSLPAERRPPTWALTRELVNVGSAVVAYGFARTQWKVHGALDGVPNLAMNLDPGFYRGTVVTHHANGRGITPWPVYEHDAETGGGISGGPLIGVLSSTVCGVNCTGVDGAGYGTATDVRSVLDWPIPFAQNKTLRTLAIDGFVVLR